MSDVESENFENADLISLVSVVEPPKPSIQDEIGRGQKIYRNRRGLKEQSAAEKILPLYEKPGQTKKKSFKTRPSYYYRLICEELKDGRQRSYKACKHSGNCVLDRDILTRREHDTFLAQPRLVVYKLFLIKICITQLSRFSCVGAKNQKCTAVLLLRKKTFCSLHTPH